MIELGSTTCSNIKWYATLALSEIGDWIVLPVEEDGSLKMLLANVRTGVKKEETFSQLEDGLWTAKYVDVPDEREGVYSNVESVRKNRFSVNYNYRTESDDSAPRYNQVCVYEFDSLAGEFVITEVGDRKPE